MGTLDCQVDISVKPQRFARLLQMDETLYYRASAHPADERAFQTRQLNNCSPAAYPSRHGLGQEIPIA